MLRDTCKQTKRERARESEREREREQEQEQERQRADGKLKILYKTKCQEQTVPLCHKTHGIPKPDTTRAEVQNSPISIATLIKFTRIKMITIEVV